MRRLALLLLIALLTPCALGSSDLARVSDQELLEAVDATTLLGRAARGELEWSDGGLDA